MKPALHWLLLASAGMYRLQAQVRYQDDVFSRTDVVRTTNVEFGQNFYFVNYPPAPPGTNSGNPQMAPLQTDLYTPPATDMETSRPLIIFLHTGSFLPKYVNQLPTGKNDDSTVVEMCTRYAMKGYVVAAPNYRTGWNPLAGSQIDRTAGILNAVYRAIHDAQTLVRFMKKEANTYGIDPSKIILMGQGSGGYVAMAYAYLDKQVETSLPKFLNAQGKSVIDTTLVGNVYGFGGAFNVYNHPGYSNQIAMVVNIGGALGDISWMEAAWHEPPIAAVHLTRDQFAPIDSGIVIVPSNGNPVVFVHGSRTVVNKAVSLGSNDIWVNHTFTDPYSTRAYQLNAKSTSEGFMELLLPELAGQAERAAPWEWWDSATVVAQANPTNPNLGISIHNNGKATNPEMGKAYALTYIDTLIGFLTPRMFLAINNPALGQTPVANALVAHKVYPNPAIDGVKISVAQGNQLRAIRVIDIQGREVRHVQGLQTLTYDLPRQQLPAGIYTLQISTDMGTVISKVTLQ